MANPFNFGTPVPPNRMVGRWHQVESVTRDLVNLGGLSHMVIAGRRFGKSSFLEALRFSLVKQMNQKKSGNWYYIPVLVDLQSLTNFSPDGVFDLLLQCLYMCFNPSSAQRILGTYLPLNLTKTRLHTYVQNGQRGCPLYEFSEIIVDFQDVFLNKYGNLRP